ncbi:hypothetical protein B0J18DRAFT_225466 [Chaetomium sp. MPI-SDFR-AT-0129]|nr:hypothetical protein B0J18DRAFT_225466 [Chaetomium sp. MPI-SDFR-AT-0129]
MGLVIPPTGHGRTDPDGWVGSGWVGCLLLAVDFFHSFFLGRLVDRESGLLEEWTRSPRLLRLARPFKNTYVKQSKTVGGQAVRQSVRQQTHHEANTFNPTTHHQIRTFTPPQPPPSHITPLLTPPVTSSSQCAKQRVWPSGIGGAPRQYRRKSKWPRVRFPGLAKKNLSTGKDFRSHQPISLRMGIGAWCVSFLSFSFLILLLICSFCF